MIQYVGMFRLKPGLLSVTHSLDWGFGPGISSQQAHTVDTYTIYLLITNYSILYNYFVKYNVSTNTLLCMANTHVSYTCILLGRCCVFFHVVLYVLFKYGGNEEFALKRFWAASSPQLENFWLQAAQLSQLSVSLVYL